MNLLNKKLKFTAYVVSSIDGKIAEEGKGLDWSSPEDKKHYHKKISKKEVVIVGNDTYVRAKSKNKWKKIIVLTESVDNLKNIDEKTIFLNPNNVNLINFIKEEGYRDVGIVGGGKTYAYCIKMNLLDEIYVTFEPYIFTHGVSMFSGDKFFKYTFELKSIKKLNKNTVLLHYIKN